MHTTNYFDTVIAVADDSVAREGTVPPTRDNPSIAELTYRMIAENPYGFTSDDVIFTVWADRKGIPAADRDQARAEFFSKGQPCLRSSDLGKRYGWGVHSDAEGRVALVAVDSDEYAALRAFRDSSSLGIGMIPYSPLAGGVLTGKYRRNQATARQRASRRERRETVLRH